MSWCSLKPLDRITPRSTKHRIWTASDHTEGFFHDLLTKFRNFNRCRQSQVSKWNTPKLWQSTAGPPMYNAATCHRSTFRWPRSWDLDASCAGFLWLQWPDFVNDVKQICHWDSLTALNSFEYYTVQSSSINVPSLEGATLGPLGEGVEGVLNQSLGRHNHLSEFQW
jgi:hypothetical protein